MLAPIGRHALGQHFHRALRSRIGRDVGASEFALHRGDIDDPTALARDHAPRPPGRRRTRCRDWSHQLAPRLLGKILERSAALDAGVVDKNVDRSDLGFDLRHGRRRPPACLVTSNAARVAPAPLARQNRDRARRPSRVRPLTTTRAPAAAKPRRAPGRCRPTSRSPARRRRSQTASDGLIPSPRAPGARLCGDPMIDPPRDSSAPILARQTCRDTLESQLADANCAPVVRAQGAKIHARRRRPRRQGSARRRGPGARVADRMTSASGSASAASAARICIISTTAASASCACASR